MSHDAPDAADAEATTPLRDRASALARRPGVWIAIAVLLIAGVLGYLQRRGPLVDVAVVARSDIEQHLVASGRVRVVTRVQVNALGYPPTTGLAAMDAKLLDRHVVESADGVELRFRAKGGFRRNVLIDDKQLAKFIKASAAVKGARLFQCVDCDEKARPVQSGDVNEYLQEISGEAVTAKDFRTWKASALAAGQLYAAIGTEGVTARKRLVRETVCEAAELLSNTPTVCRSYYVHPGLLESFEDGDFDGFFKSYSPRRQKYLSADEQVLKHFLASWKPAEG